MGLEAAGAAGGAALKRGGWDPCEADAADPSPKEYGPELGPENENDAAADGLVGGGGGCCAKPENMPSNGLAREGVDRCEAESNPKKTPAIYYCVIFYRIIIYKGLIMYVLENYERRFLCCV
jgi:hypothetical protein